MRLLSAQWLAQAPAWLRAAGLGGMGIALGGLFGFTEIGRYLDRFTYDAAVCLSPGTNVRCADSVAVVVVDRPTLDRHFGPHPYPVSQHLDIWARVVDQLTQAGARVVVLDILFDQVDTGAAMIPLATACARAGNVVLASALERKPISDMKGSYAESGVALPVTALRQVARSALTNMPLDQDNVVRRYQLAYTFLDSVYPTVPFVVADLLGRDSLPADSWFRTRHIDYRRAIPCQATISCSRILAGEDVPEVRDRVVIVGVEDSRNGDQFQTPYSLLADPTGRPTMSGLRILASAIQTVVGDSAPSGIPFWVVVALLIPLAAGWSATLTRIGYWWTIALIIPAGLVVVGTMIAAMILFPLVLPSGSVAATVLSTQLLSGFAAYVRLRRENSRLEEELCEARQVQQRLLPSHLPVVEGMTVAARMIPAGHVTGDYYDVFKISEHELGVFVADVCGKGAAAGLAMSNLQATLHGLGPLLAEPAKVMAQLNAALESWLDRGKFVTAFYTVVDRSQMRCRYCNAGHNPPLLCGSESRLQELPGGGLVLGALAGFPYEENSIALSPGDALVLYTDGIGEAVNPKGEQFGERVFPAHVVSHRGYSATGLVDSLFTEVGAFSRGRPLADDATIVVLQVV